MSMLGHGWYRFLFYRSTINSKLLQKLFKSTSIFQQPIKLSAVQQVSSLHTLSRKSSPKQQQVFLGARHHSCPSIFRQPGLSCLNAVYRSCSGIVSPQGSRNRDITLNKEELSVRYGHYHLDLPYVWLRDHCRCDVCYNHQTCQKNIDNFELDLDIRPTEVSFDGTVLTIECNFLISAIIVKSKKLLGLIFVDFQFFKGS